MNPTLSASAWTSLLKRYKDKKFDGKQLTDALKRNARSQTEATLRAVIAVARQLKDKAPDRDLLEHLDDVVDAASEELEAAGKESTDDDLKSLLAACRKRTADKPLYFAVAPGKIAGLVLKRRAISEADKKRARDERPDGQAPALEGKVYSDSGAIVFDFGTDTPPGGLAKQIKRTALARASTNIRVKLRHAGGDIDDEHDVEPAAPDASTTWRQRVAQFASEAVRRSEPPIRDPDGALLSLTNAARTLVSTLLADKTLPPDIAQELRNQVAKALQQAHTALEKARAAAPASRDGSPAASGGSLDEQLRSLEPLRARVASVPVTANDRSTGIFKHNFASTWADLVDAAKRGDAATFATLRQRAVDLGKAAIDNNRAFTAFHVDLAAADAELERARNVPKDANSDTLRRLVAAFQQADRELHDFSASCRWQKARDQLVNVVQLARHIDQGRGAARDQRARDLAKAKADRTEFERLANVTLQPLDFRQASPDERQLRARLAGGDREFAVYVTAHERMQQAHAIWTKISQDDKAPRETREKAALAARTAAQQLVTIAGPLADELGKQLPTADDPDTKKKRERVDGSLKTARQFLIGLSIRELGTPDPVHGWSEDQQRQVLQLRAQIAFETGYARGSSLNEEGTSGASISFWVESKEPSTDGTGQRTKNFIFKPILESGANTVEELRAATANESLAASTGQLLERMTGLQLGVPTTAVVELDSSALAVTDKAHRGRHVGSLQQFERTDGAVTELPGGLGQVAPEECQKLAILDILTLNYDRNDGNVLARRGGPNGSPQLVPIDHGGTFPSAKKLRQGGAHEIGGINNNGGVKNMLLTIPGSHEPFSPQMLRSIELLDPEAMRQGMLDHLKMLAAAHPQLACTGPEAEEKVMLSMRSAEFLKLAAPTLSPAMIQITIAENVALFTDFKTAVPSFAPRLIQAASARRDAQKELLTLPKALRSRVARELQGLNWTDVDRLLTEHPEEALLAWKLKIPCTAGVDIVAATRGATRQAASTAAARRYLAEARTLLDEDGIAPGTFLQQQRTLEQTVPATAADARTHELRAQRQYQAVAVALLQSLRTSGDAAYKQAMARVHDADTRSKVEMLYTDFKRACGAELNVQTAKDFAQTLAAFVQAREKFAREMAEEREARQGLGS